MKFLYIHILLILNIFMSVPIMAQTFTAEAPKHVDVNEYFRVSFRATTSDVADFTPPSLNDFEILAGPSVSKNSSFQMINGRTTSSTSTTYTYVLSPKGTGTFTIMPATINVGGTTLKSNSVNIQVTGNTPKQGTPQAQNQTQTQPDEEALQAAGSRVTERDLYIVVTPSHTTRYEQEAVVLTYRIYARAGVGLSNVSLSQKPDFTGLISQELPVKNIQMHTESVNGSIYRTGTILQYVVFPQHSGRIEVPSISFTCTVAQRQHIFDDPFDAFFNSGGSTVGVQVERRVKPIYINVKPLPEPRPANFSGGVGQFQLKGELLSPTPKSNDVANYRISITGTGNLSLLTPPQLQLPNDFDSYEPEITDQSETTFEGGRGTVLYDYTFVPRNIGQYEIPAVEYVVFNPVSGQYETLRTSSIHLDVKQGKRTNADVQHELQLRNSDIRALKQGETRVNPKHPFWWGTWGYGVVYVSILVLAGLLFHLLKKRMIRQSDTLGNQRRRAGRVATRRLKQARRLLEKGAEREFFDELSQAMQGYIADKFNVPLSEMSEERIEEILSRPDMIPEARERFCQTLNDCECARFSPHSDPQGRKRLYTDAVIAIDMLEK